MKLRNLPFPEGLCGTGLEVGAGNPAQALLERTMHDVSQYDFLRWGIVLAQDPHRQTAFAVRWTWS